MAHPLAPQVLSELGHRASPAPSRGPGPRPHPEAGGKGEWAAGHVTLGGGRTGKPVGPIWGRAASRGAGRGAGRGSGANSQRNHPFGERETHAQAATWPAAHVENPGCPSAAPAGVYGQAAGFRVKVGIPTRTWRFCCCWTESSRNGKWVLLAQEAVILPLCCFFVQFCRLLWTQVPAAFHCAYSGHCLGHLGQLCSPREWTFHHYVRFLSVGNFHCSEVYFIEPLKHSSDCPSGMSFLSC